MRYFETDEYQAHCDEVARDERWLRDMAKYDAEEQAIQEYTALALGLEPAVKMPWTGTWRCLEYLSVDGVPF